jgi:hypothetical protein
VNKLIIFAAFIIFVACLIGCKEGFEIVAIDNGDLKPTFRFMSGGVLSSPGVEIDSFYLYKGKEDFVWRIESKDQKRHLVKEIKYGVIPDGFHVVIVPRKLISGNNYVAGSMMPGKVGWVDFVLK